MNLVCAEQAYIRCSEGGGDMAQARIQKLKEGGAEWIARAAREIFCNHAHSAV